jgi:hypothetical protein
LVPIGSNEKFIKKYMLTNHRMGESKKMKKRLRLSLVVVLSLVVSICGSMTTFAASEKRVDINESAYVTISNIVEEQFLST